MKPGPARLCLGILTCLIFSPRPGARGAEEEPPAAASAARIKAHVQALAVRIGERNPYRPRALLNARDYIRDELARYGYAPELQEYRGKGLPAFPEEAVFYNVVAALGEDRKSEAGIWVVGAHYDSAPGTPGADDNASGVAVLLELARLLRGKTLDKELRLVAFSTEEPPSFGTKNMGSHHYAQRLKARGEKVRGMISLEMLGYYSPKPKSQRYPPILRWLYPDRGDFIALVGDLPSLSFLRSVRKTWRARSDFPLETAGLPRFIPAISLSDHLNFWQAGFPALMLTDTAFFRNPNYHTTADTPETLDYERMAKLTETLAAVLEKGR
ncbi:MAG: M28 family peptidase [Elusimicrobiota bacterium]